MVAKTNQIYLLSIKQRVSLQSSIVKSGSLSVTYFDGVQCQEKLVCEMIALFVRQFSQVLVMILWMLMVMMMKSQKNRKKEIRADRAGSYLYEVSLSVDPAQCSW